MRLTFDDVFHMRDGLARLRDNLSIFTIKHGPDPTTASQAFLDEASFIPSRPVIEVRSHAAYLIEVCGEHITTLVKTLTIPVEVMAPWTCLRATLEAAAVAAWLLDPNVGTKERAGRSFAHQAEGMRHQKNFARAARNSDDMAHADSAAANWARLAQEAGFHVVPTKPSATDLVQKVLRKPWLYRLSSGVMHGHIWTLHLCFDVSGSIPMTSPATGLPMRGIRKETKPDMLGYVLVASAEAFARPCWYQCLYMGWDSAELESLLEGGFDAMNLSERGRFWRHRST